MVFFHLPVTHALWAGEVWDSQKTTGTFSRVASFVCLVGVSFPLKIISFVFLFWGIFFLSSRISWCKSELNIEYCHLTDVVL